MKKLILGLGSKAQIGKDYAAQKLKDLGYDIERIAFADELKKDLSNLFFSNGLNFESIVAEPELKKLVRPLMVEYGQVLRSFKPDVWIDRAFHKVRLNGVDFQCRSFDHEITMITDVRFPNEVKRIKELGGIYIEIISNVAPANETEALYSPLMSTLADHTIVNNFDGEYIKNFIELIDKLRL
jgi:hypothetical protein